MGAGGEAFRLVHQTGRKYVMDDDGIVTTGVLFGCFRRADERIGAMRCDEGQKCACGAFRGGRPGPPTEVRIFLPLRNDAVLDCVLVDISPDGAQVCLVAWAELPEHVTLLLPNAGSRPMRRRWQQGSFIGFQAVGDAVPLS